MESEKSIQFESVTRETYLFGVFLFIISAAGIIFMMYDLGVHPYIVAVLYSFSTTCAISFFPHETLLLIYGKTMNLWLLAGLATVGSVLAGYIDYKFFIIILNLPYSAKYKSTKTFKKAFYWFNRFPFLSIIIAGFTPIPFFPVKFMVFSTKYSFSKYLLGIAVSRFPRYYLIALSGFILQIPDWLIFGSFAVMLTLIYHRKIFQLGKWIYGYVINGFSLSKSN